MLVCLTGVEPVTHSLEGCCSIQLSYRHRLPNLITADFCRGGETRTRDLLHPKQTRYQLRYTPNLLSANPFCKLQAFADFQKGRKYTAQCFVLQIHNPQSSTLCHQGDEIIKQIVRIVRTGRGFRVILHGENRQFLVAKSLDSLVVKVQVREF